MYVYVGPSKLSFQDLDISLYSTVEMSQSNTSRCLEAQPLLSLHTFTSRSRYERFTSVCCLPRYNARTNVFYHSFFPHTIALWNSLPQSVLSSQSVLSFKNNLLLSCLLYTSPSPRDATLSRMPSSA